jgi:hypothetical protein
VSVGSEGFSSRRVAWLAGGLVIVGAVSELALARSVSGAVSLTAAGVVAIINFRWLEALVQRVVQPGRPRFDRWSVLRFAGRMLLFGAAVAALAWAPRVDFVAVALGFSALVVSLVVEGIRWGREGGG